MRHCRTARQPRDLARAVLLLLVLMLIPVSGTRAECTPPGQPAAPISVEQGALSLGYTYGGVTSVPPGNETYEQEVVERVWADVRRGNHTRVGSKTIYLNVPALGNVPNALSFTYSIPDNQLLPTAHPVTPMNVGDDEPLTWTVTAEGNWLTVEPINSTSPASFWITPTTFSTGTVATHTGTVTVTVVEPSGTKNSPHRVDVALQVVNTPLNTTYLPLALNNYTHVSPPSASRYPNDPAYSQQWPLEKMDAPAAWGISTGQGTLVAVLDTGTDLDHPDLAEKARADIDWDFVNSDAVADDDHGHGTHVSGIVAAATDNGLGMAGVDWEGTILPLKVLRSDGYGTETDLAEAIRYAADHGADVINMSLGGPSDNCPQYVQDAVDYAHAKGVVLVAAAGNHSGSKPNAEMSPANCTHVLGVAATEPDDSVAWYSNYGTHVSVAAPGSAIYSTLLNGQYGDKSGTSMATPHVAGLAALVRASFPSYTPDQIASAILDNAEDLGTAEWDPYTGCGRVNALPALSVGARGTRPVCLEGIGLQQAEAVKEAVKAPITARFVPGELVVSLRPGINAQTMIQQHGVGAGAAFLPALGAWRLRVPSGEEQATLSRLRADPAVAYADLNYLVSTQ